jgi:hypothetical protein
MHDFILEPGRIGNSKYRFQFMPIIPLECFAFLSAMVGLHYHIRPSTHDIQLYSAIDARRPEHDGTLPWVEANEFYMVLYSSSLESLKTLAEDPIRGPTFNAFRAEISRTAP